MNPTEPNTTLDTVTVHLSENERLALERLTLEKQLTPEQIIRLALATYEAVSDYRQKHTGEPMPWERRKWGEPFGAGLAE